mmetsp:Transcript_11208/g.28368  ORF Transcript_11208/g.28368 Transcript_11208/m.28368 type:complete len:225 (+) Transcript_11208:2-676(+)
MYNGPARGGTRGGRDQFKWEDVKGDKYRENYLGHSVHATVGRWQNGRDLLWYSRDKQGEAGGSSQELRAVKQREEELMQEALGLKPKTAVARQQNKMEKHELAELLRRGRTVEERDDRFAEAERIKGVGTAASAHQQVAERNVLEGEGIIDSFFDKGEEQRDERDQRRGGESRGPRTGDEQDERHSRRRHRRRRDVEQDGGSKERHRHRRRHRRHRSRSRSRSR